VKSSFPALCAEFKFKTDVFFMILLRKIKKTTSVSKEYSAAEGGKRFLAQPPKISFHAELRRAAGRGDSPGADHSSIFRLNRYASDRVVLVTSCLSSRV
jgi:hypothetical protein